MKAMTFVPLNIQNCHLTKHILGEGEKNFEKRVDGASSNNYAFFIETKHKSIYFLYIYVKIIPTIFNRLSNMYRYFIYTSPLELLNPPPFTDHQ